MLYNSMFYGYYSILYLGYYCRMVFGARSSVRGRSLGYGRGHGQGRVISVHDSIHEGPLQEGNRDEHVSEYQEEDHGEWQANSKEVNLRQMMKTIIDCLPLVHDQDRAHQIGPEHKPRSRSP